MRLPLHRRAMALGTILMFVATAMMVAFTTVAVVSFQMSTGLRQTGAHAAHNAAESALSVAIARIGDTQGNFGNAGTEEVRVPGLDGEVGIVTFVHGATESRQGKSIAVPFSTHNFVPLNPTTAKPGYRRTVPTDAIHLVGTGITQSGMVSHVEAIVYFPPFTYAIASSGPLNLDSVIVAGVKDPADLPRDASGVPTVDVNQLSTGDVGCNQAMVLTRSTVKGDAQAAQAIDISNSVVEGETRPHAAELHIPNYNLADYDPGGQTISRDLADSFDEPVLSGNARRAGSLVVPNDLKLDNGFLYVTGDLTVSGGLKGKGMVVVHGNATVSGSASVAATDNTALLCDGNVTINGGAAFQGLVYCKGSFHASHVDLIGTFLQNSTNPAADVQLSDVRVIYQNNVASVSLFRTGSFLFCDSSATPIYSEALPKFDGTTQLNVANGAVAPNLDALVRPDLQAQWGTSEFTDYCHKHCLMSVTKRNGQILYTMFIRGRMTDGDGDAPPTRGLLPGSPWQSLPTDVYPGRCISVFESNDRQALFDMIKPHQVWEEMDEGAIQAWQATMSAHLDMAAQVDIPLASLQKVNYQFNPSRFLTPYDAMRIMLWADIP